MKNVVTSALTVLTSGIVQVNRVQPLIFQSALSIPTSKSSSDSICCKSAIPRECSQRNYCPTDHVQGFLCGWTKE